MPFMSQLLVNTWVTQSLAGERVAVIELTLLHTVDGSFICSFTVLNAM